MIDSFDPKDPDEVDFFNIDFSARLPLGDAIASIVLVFVAEGDSNLQIDQFAFSGNIVSGRWRFGTKRARYLITARVATTQGRTVDLSGYVTVDDT
jgi:hypothetical protein